MDEPTYVVHSRDSDDPQLFKHFSGLPAARVFAAKQVETSATDRAEIWAVRATDARAAVAALKMGEGELVELRSPHASEAELQREREREWKIAVNRGPEAVLKFLGLD
jgi:hypothetical protein